MNCVDLQHLITIHPGSTGLYITPFTVYSTVTSTEAGWLSSDKVIISDIYTGDDYATTLIDSITSYDFFKDIVILSVTGLDSLTAVHTVSADDNTVCTITYTGSALMVYPAIVILDRRN